MRKQTRAFTLIEVLVVIAMLALLAGLTFAVAKQAIDARERMRCLNSLRQWIIALEMYANDHEGAYPPSGQLFNRTPEVGLLMTNYLSIADSGSYTPDHLPLAMCKSGIAGFANNTAYVGWSLFAGYTGPAALINDYAGANLSTEKSAKESRLAVISCLTASAAGGTLWTGHSVKAGTTPNLNPAGQLAGWADGQVRWVKFEDLGIAVNKIDPTWGPLDYYMPKKDLL